MHETQLSFISNSSQNMTHNDCGGFSHRPFLFFCESNFWCCGSISRSSECMLIEVAKSRKQEERENLANIMSKNSITKNEPLPARI